MGKFLRTTGCLIAASFLGAGSVNAQTATPTVTPYPFGCSVETEWGGVGTGPGLFNQTRQMAVFGNVIYVTDKGNNLVQRFDLSGTPILPALNGGGTLNQPFGVGVGPTGRVFVSENGYGSGQRLLEIDPNTNTVVSTIQSGNTNLGGVGVDSNGDVYVTRMNDVDPEMASKYHESPPGVWSRVSILMDHGAWVNAVVPISGGTTVYVADTGNDRIAEFVETSPDNYKLTRNVVENTAGNPPGYTVWPKQLTVDAQGYFYITDIAYRFQVFGPDWLFRYVCTTASVDSFGIAVDGSGYIYQGLEQGIIRKYRPTLMPPPYMSPTPVPPDCGSALKAAYVYPSPLSPGPGHVYVQLCRTDQVKIHFFNAAGGLAGKLEFTGHAGDNDVTYDFSGYASGVYYALVQTGGQRQPLRKFAIIR